MTITTTNVSETTATNGVVTQFTYSFVGGQSSYISVTLTDSTGAATVLDPSVYTLAMNAPVAPNLWGIGGSVTYAPSGTPVASGSTLTITRSVPDTQTTSISNQAFQPNAIEMAMDRIVMEIQGLAAPQTEEALIPVTAPATPSKGWLIYVDTADNKLKAKASTGTVVTLGTP